MHSESRTPRSGDGLKNLLHAPYRQNQGFLSVEVEEMVYRCGVYAIGVDLDAENGIGKVTFDLLLPAENKKCYALTCETLYDAASRSVSGVTPETVQETITVARAPSKGLTGPARKDRKPLPEHLEKKQLKRNRQDSPSAEKAKE